MDCWLSIEVFDAAVPASVWRRAHGDALTEAAFTNGALQWEWHEHSWGVVIEVEFADEDRRNAFRMLPGVQAVLDAAPDPVSGLLVYPGRGGGSGARVPRRPRPIPSAGAAALPIPHEPEFVRLGGDTPHAEHRGAN
ncbi:MAG: hypothetical protein GEU98_21655 [Pseudonocardiaceae bacterium]|nr:hypothetical protein [Pseudonocardiaceae bacterium]